MRDLAAFSAIKVFYDSDRDLLDIVCGLILCLIDEGVNNGQKLQVKINEKFSLDIPSDVIQSALKRLRNKYQFIECVGGYAKIVLTSSGREEQKRNQIAVEQTRKQYREILVDIKSFIQKESKKEISLQDARGILKDAILNNPSDVFKFAFPSNTQAHTNALSIIGEYVLQEEKHDSQKFETLKSIIYGNILALALESGRIEIGGKLNKLNIYFDSNIIFSLLRLDDDLQNNTAMEMLKVLKSFGVDLKIFSFTLDEIKTKLSFYAGKYHAYSSDIEVDSIYFRIKAKGLKETDILLLIDSLEKSLNELGIAVDYTSTRTELTDFDRGLIPKLTEIKEGRPLSQKIDNKSRQSGNKHPAVIEHDLLAIRAISEIRGRAPDRIESSKAIFLTADTILAKFDYEEYRHLEKRTIPEVFFRSQLVNFLWFKNPETSTLLPIHDLMSGYIQTKMISEKLWDTFIWELRKQVEQNKYTKEDVSTLISLSETKSALYEIQAEGVGYPELIRKKIIDSGLIEEAKIAREENEKLKKYKKETEDILEERNGEIERSNRILLGVNKNIENSCIIFWSKVIDISIYTTLLIPILVIIKLGFQNNFKLSDISSILSILAALFFVIIIVFSLIKKKPLVLVPYLVDKRKTLENKLIQWCIKRKKEKLGLFEER